MHIRNLFYPKEMSDEKTLIHEMQIFISKAGASIAAIAIGVMAKISHDIMLKKRHSFLEWLAIVGVSVFGGYLMAQYCLTHHLEDQGKYLIPMATLFSEKLIMYITANWNKIMRVLLNRKP